MPVGENVRVAASRTPSCASSAFAEIAPLSLNLLPLKGETFLYLHLFFSWKEKKPSKQCSCTLISAFSSEGLCKSVWGGEAETLSEWRLLFHLLLALLFFFFFNFSDSKF